ncbi:MAG: DUF1549 domain-containing protein [Planctomyces sp.]|nr:DUF1549 domain-containing protein [Planctomyces sp.]
MRTLSLEPSLFRFVRLLALVSAIQFGAQRVLGDDNPDSAVVAEGGNESVSLAQWIDGRLATGSASENGPLCNDTEFIRRVSLDLTGMPPTADDARSFSADTTADKRRLLVDRLMASAVHTRHLALTLDVMLMERRPNTLVSQDEWIAWLMSSVRSNKPWNQLVREMILADGDDPANRAPARFILDRGAEPNVVARDIGRMFLGMDLQCAQCHDSPLVSDFLQADYQGLLAFTSPMYTVVRKHGDKDVTVLSERAGTDLTFESVFARGTPHRTGTRLPGTGWIDEPVYLPGEEYDVAPADGVKAVPRFSRRKLLAERLTDGSNAAFNRNAANRLWSVVFGRGVMHPLDMLHPDNAGPAETFLDELGTRFCASGYDIRWFLKELVLTRTYQRAFDFEESGVSQPAIVTQAGEEMQVRLEDAERTARAANDQYSAASTAFDAAEAALIPVSTEFETVRGQYAETWKKLTEARKAAADAAGIVTTKRSTADQALAAATHAETAAGLLSADPELAVIAGKLRERAAQVTAELPALQAAADEKAAAVKPVEDLLATQRVTVEAAQAKLSPLRSELSRTDVARVEARGQLQKASWRVADLKNQMQLNQEVRSYLAVRSEVEGAELVLQRLESEQQQLKKSIDDSTLAMTAIADRMQVAEKELGTVLSSMEAAAGRLAVSEQRYALVADAARSLDAATQFVPADEGLSQTRLAAVGQLSRMETLLNQCRQECDTMTEMHRVASARLETVKSEMQTAQTALSQSQQAIEIAVAAINVEKTKMDETSGRLDSMSHVLASSFSNRFQLSTLRPLSPEQLCWSVFRVTTVYDRYVASERVELDKAAPLTDEQRNDAGVMATREQEIEQRVYDKLKQYIPTYVQFYGGGAGQPQGDFYASADQALFTSNAGQINSWVVPAGDNASERMVKATDPRKAAEELYLGILSRMPAEEEVAEVTAALEGAADRAQVAQELMWGLLNSAEFRFNH